MNLLHLLVLFPDSLSKSVDLKPWKQIKRMVWRQIDKKQRDPICRSGCAYITLRHGSSKEPAYRRLERCVGGVREDFHLTDSFLLRPRVQSDGEEREREREKNENGWILTDRNLLRAKSRSAICSGLAPLQDREDARWPDLSNYPELRVMLG